MLGHRPSSFCTDQRSVPGTISPSSCRTFPSTGTDRLKFLGGRLGTGVATVWPQDFRPSGVRDEGFPLACLHTSGKTVSELDSRSPWSHPTPASLPLYHPAHGGPVRR